MGKSKKHSSSKDQLAGSKRITVDELSSLLYPRYMSLEALQAAAAAAAAATTAAAAAAATAAAASSSQPGTAQQQPSSHEQQASILGDAQGAALQQPSGKPLTKFEIKRLKRAARRQGTADGGQAAAQAGALGTGEGPAEAQEHTQPQAVEANAGKTSGKGNSSEAQRIREALGYVEPAAGHTATPDQPAAAAPEEGTARKKKKAKKAEAASAAAAADSTAQDAPLLAEPPSEATASGKPPAAAANGKGFRFGFQAVVQAQVEAQTEAKLNRIMMVDSATKDGFVPRRVFICGLPHEYDEATLREYWSFCGEIESLDMLVFPDTGNFNGVMFITFKAEAGYEAALACNGEELEGRTLRVERCKAAAAKKVMQVAFGSSGGRQAAAGPAGRVEGYNVAYVGNLAYDATRDELMEMFRPYNAELVRLHTDKDTGKPKGFAHVHFPDAESLERAMEMDGTEVQGRAIKMSFAQPKKGG